MEPCPDAMEILPPPMNTGAILETIPPSLNAVATSAHIVVAGMFTRAYTAPAAATIAAYHPAKSSVATAVPFGVDAVTMIPAAAASVCLAYASAASWNQRFNASGTPHWMVCHERFPAPK